MTLLSTHNCTTVIYCTISLLLCLRRNSSFKFAMLLQYLAVWPVKKFTQWNGKLFPCNYVPEGDLLKSNDYAGLGQDQEIHTGVTIASHSRPRWCSCPLCRMHFSQTGSSATLEHATRQNHQDNDIGARIQVKSLQMFQVIQSLQGRINLVINSMIYTCQDQLELKCRWVELQKQQCFSFQLPTQDFVTTNMLPLKIQLHSQRDPGV